MNSAKYSPKVSEPFAAKKPATTLGNVKTHGLTASVKVHKHGKKLS